MNSKEYLNEEIYEKSKKKVLTIALIVLIGGILIGGSLITTGILKSNKARENSSNNTRTKEVIQADIDEVNSELSKKQKECSSFDNDEFDCFSEISTLQTRLSALKSELWKVQSGFNDVEDSFSTSKYIPFYIFGGFIIVASCMISFSIYMFAKRREIMAFSVQQVLPVAQEGLEKVTPTIGNTVETVAKSITKGIKKGLNDDEDK